MKSIITTLEETTVVRGKINDPRVDSASYNAAGDPDMVDGDPVEKLKKTGNFLGDALKTAGNYYSGKYKELTTPTIKNPTDIPQDTVSTSVNSFRPSTLIPKFDPPKYNKYKDELSSSKKNDSDKSAPEIPQDTVSTSVNSFGAGADNLKKEGGKIVDKIVDKIIPKPTAPKYNKGQDELASMKKHEEYVGAQKDDRSVGEKITAGIRNFNIDHPDAWKYAAGTAAAAGLGAVAYKRWKNKKNNKK